MVTEGKETRRSTIVAELVWLDFDQAQIKEACKGHKGVMFKNGGTFLDTLVAATMGVLTVDEDADFENTQIEEPCGSHKWVFQCYGSAHNTRLGRFQLYFPPSFMVEVL